MTLKRETGSNGGTNHQRKKRKNKGEEFQLYMFGRD